jgi:actin-related protein
MSQFNRAIVIDNGTDSCKVGFAGDSSPFSVVPTVIAVNSNTNDCYVGNDISKAQGVNFKVKRPMQYGIVVDWTSMEKIWNHIFYNELKVAPEEHAVMVTEGPLNPKGNREKMTQIMFEEFNIPALYVANQGVLSLYASGRTTGVVLDCGHGASHAIPIYEGNMNVNAITRFDWAGDTLTDYLVKLLQKKGYSFNTAAEYDIVRLDFYQINC